MEIQVKIAKILESQSFVSKKDGLTYTKHHFLGTTSGQYPKNIAFSVMGDDKFREMNLVVGNEYTVYFDVNSREWNGKWFTDVSCWRCVPVGVVPQGQAPVATPNQVQQPVENVVNTPFSESNDSSDDKLPF